ncbi:MAG: phosphohydrolase [Deltaproteobacteria bacterium GWC2_56_8]|nr:MAG: phosphohydrolase [Deltaproteobacteria bacterium GWB2_55_19]OGP35920.1 MAG: phosphohydrolase [Deltaproteobacteria bacterium GWC2_56_8]HAO92389.1 phosphohydrolase [Deltaproteobacteria bacterium]
MERAELFSELDGRLRQFSTLQEVGNLLNSTLDQKVVRHRAMEAITSIMRAEAGSLLLVDELNKQLYFEVALGEKGDEIKEVRLNIGEGIAGWVAKHGRPLVINDVASDKRFQANVDRKSRFTTRDMVCVPVRIKGKVIGVLQAINRIGGTFEKEDLRLFQLFSNQVAIALDNARLYEEIRETFHATSEALAEAIEKRDPYTGGHTKRVFEYSLAIGKHMGMPAKALEILKLSAVLHDIGKIGIEDRILRKDAPLDAEEAAVMRLHPQYGAEIMKHVPQLKDIVPGMLYHHERVDGQGYPRGFKGEQIPLIARVISVADTYDAMTTTRPYRKGLPPAVAIAELRKFTGVQFDAQVVEAFIRAFEKGDITGAIPAAASGA